MARYYSYDGLRVRELARVECPVCRGERGDPIGVDNGFSIERCVEPGCGFVYVNPRPSSDQLRDLYATFYTDDAVVPEKWDEEMGAIFAECRRWLVQWRRAGAVLDIGCSFGHFLRGMEQAGWRATGIEPSPVAARFAADLLEGEVLATDFEAAELADESFDAVVSLYVLEHVSDPRAFVEKVFRVLRPDGRAIIRIPWTAPLFPLNRLLRRPLMYAPMHLNDFTPEAFHRLARDVGFRESRARVGARRRSHDFVENAGARVLGGLGRAVEIATRGRRLFPLVGALSYQLVK